MILNPKKIDKRYIPGASYNESTGEFNIPEHALPPYTQAKARGDKIYGSIIYAVLNNKRPIPEKYGISDNEFYSVYVDYLVKRNLLATFVEDGVTYFRSTPESKKFEGFARVKIQKIVWGLVQTAIALAQLAV